jgi:hypothetical protein
MLSPGNDQSIMEKGIAVLLDPTQVESVASYEYRTVPFCIAAKLGELTLFIYEGDISMMDITQKTTIEHAKAMNLQAPEQEMHDRGVKVGRFVLRLLEMLIAMQVGMGVFHLMLGLIRTYSSSRALESGTTLHAIVMTVFMTIPMAAWMIIRGHGWRHCIEMIIAMIAPVAFIGLLCQLGVDQYLPWLAGLSTPLMFLGMIFAMLYRRDHYIGTKSHVVADANVEREPSCHEPDMDEGSLVKSS